MNQPFKHFFFPMSDRVISLIAVQALCPIALLAMTNQESAVAKDAEGKLESAYGELTGDTGHQIKGKAKQMEASAMNVAEDIKQGVQSAAQKGAGAAKKLSEDLS
ncbi:MAG: CsbD family protein [Cyanobacteriota bacterium]